MNIITWISIGIIALVLFLIYTKTNLFENFKISKKFKKGVSKATKTVSKGIKKATKEVAKVTKVVTKGVKKTYNTTKNKVSNTKNLINKTKKMIRNTKTLMGSLSKKIENFNSKLKIVKRKRNFSLYLKKKTLAKIAHLNALIAIAKKLPADKSAKTARKNEVLKKKIKAQINAIKMYRTKTSTNSSNTKNLLKEIKYTQNNIIETNKELLTTIAILNPMIENTKQAVASTNIQITTTNNQIIADNPSITTKPIPTPVEDDTGDSSSSQSTEQTASQSTEQTASQSTEQTASQSTEQTASQSTEQTATPSTEQTETQSTEQTVSEQSSEKLEDSDISTDIELIAPLAFNADPITIPTNIVIPDPTLIDFNVDELVIPEFIEPDISTLFSTETDSSASASTDAITDSNTDADAEAELNEILPKEEVIPLPEDVDSEDIQDENNLINELK